MTKSPEIDITVQSERWPADIHSVIIKAAQTALREAGYMKHAELSIVLADDAFIQDLNKTWRNQDKPTNVLSFPQDSEEMLGDVIMAFETLEREAHEQGKSFNDHVKHMTIHGILHLLGFDHETEREAEEMESLEIRALATLGVKTLMKAEILCHNVGIEHVENV
jgi:probable rRNA maturation factor